MGNNSVVGLDTDHLPTFVISLASALERREHMAVQLGTLGIPFEFYEAVDGRALGEQEVKAVYDDVRAKATFWGALNRGELGCALSHIGVWREIATQNLSCALVLEDDAVLSEHARDVIQAASRLLNSNDVAVLVPTDANSFLFRQCALPHSHRLVYVNQVIYTATGYLMTAGAARRLLERVPPITAPIDFWYHAEGFRGVTPIRAVLPAVATQAMPDRFPSQIGGRSIHLAPAQAAGKRRSMIRRLVRSVRLKIKNRLLVWPVRFD